MLNPYAAVFRPATGSMLNPYAAEFRPASNNSDSDHSLVEEEMRYAMSRYLRSSLENSSSNEEALDYVMWRNAMSRWVRSSLEHSASDQEVMLQYDRLVEEMYPVSESAVSENYPYIPLVDQESDDEVWPPLPLHGPPEWQPLPISSPPSRRPRPCRPRS
jgi:hypothetical protein